MVVEGRDIEHEITIDFLSALKGFEIEMSIEKNETMSGLQWHWDKSEITIYDMCYMRRHRKN